MTLKKNYTNFNNLDVFLRYNIDLPKASKNHL